MNFIAKLQNAVKFYEAGNYQEAATYYSLAIVDIDNQIKNKDFPFSEKLKLVYENAIFTLIQCYLNLSLTKEAINTILFYNLTQHETLKNKALLLQAKAYHQRGDLHIAISLLKKINDLSEKITLDKTFLESQFLLATLLIENNNLLDSKEILKKCIDHLDCYQHQWATLTTQPISDVTFWMYKIEGLYHLSKIFQGHNDNKTAIDYLLKAKEAYEKCSNHLNTKIGNPAKLMALLVYSELFHLLIHTGDIRKDLLSALALQNLMDDVLSIAKENVKINAIKTFMLILKTQYEENQIHESVLALNKLLEWILKIPLPQELKFLSSMIAANIYLQPQSCHPALALRFLQIAENAIINLQNTSKVQAQFEGLLMQLICHHHLNDLQHAILVFNQIKKLIVNENSDYHLFYIDCFDRLKPLFPKEFSFLNQTLELQLLVSNLNSGLKNQTILSFCKNLPVEGHNNGTPISSQSSTKARL